jgi:protein-tyrosine phosphatase
VSEVADGSAPVSEVADGAAPVSELADGAAPVSEPLHVTFICSGNICRSPMAEKMFAQQISERGLADEVRVTSAGTGDWHAGEGADNRANRVLREHGYPTEHQARRINGDHLTADLVVALGRNHERILRDMGVAPPRLRMLRSFDPKSAAHPLDVEDPYYGTQGDFEDVLAVIEASLPGLHDWVDEQLAARGIAS